MTWECWFCGGATRDGFEKDVHTADECQRVLLRRKVEALETLAGNVEAYVKHMGVSR